ncbi:MAG: phosphatase PAP2 family protein [Bacteroidetes bacterium]|nr:phosphatase PAP2 family protein [Bacteroidota bacterium]
MLESLKSFDQTLFLFLNGHHSSFFDPIVYWGTNPVSWLPLYILLLYLLVRRYRWHTFWILLFAAIMILFSDQLANISKDMVVRPRPTYEPGLTGLHTVNGYFGGRFGFYSAHASTNLAIAVYMIILLGRPFPCFPLLMLVWALFMAYSRIYLGVHYPGDIIAGWIAGGLIGWCFGQLSGWFVRKPINFQTE